MPLHGPLPDHHGELRFAQSLLDIDDGHLHLIFDVMLPGVSNIDVVIWDELEGVFCLEVKAVPIQMVQEVSLHEIVIEGRGRGKSPMSQARKGTFELLSLLREVLPDVPWLTATAAWPLIERRDWQAHWGPSSIPPAYAESMMFSEDVESIETLRSRLRWVRKNAPFGSVEPRNFVHDQTECDQFIAYLIGRAAAVHRHEQEVEAGTARSTANATCAGRDAATPARDRIVLDTDSVRDAAHSMLNLVVEAESSLSADWAIDVRRRVQEIVRRLNRPFKLGIAGEFRAGKSSVLNALVGVELALTDSLECTFCPHRIAHGPEEVVRISSATEIWECSIVESLALQREAVDSPDHKGITLLETFLPAGILESIEIWDSPGFGGSESHNAAAEEFVEQIDAALWVFNKDYMGQRQLDEVLRSLKNRGKSMIGVVNKSENVSGSKFEDLRRYLERAYPGVGFSALIPFSAQLALDPESSDSREGLATDGSGNIDMLLEILRSQIIANPGRLSARAAAGDLRSICYSVRDDLQRNLLEEKRRMFLYRTQFERGKALVRGRLASVGESLEVEGLTNLREELSRDSQRELKKLSGAELRDPERFKRRIKDSVSKENVRRILDAFFIAQRGRIAEAVRAAGVDTFEDFVGRLTEFERLGQTDRWSLNVQVAESSARGNDTPAVVAMFTGVALGTVALAIPGPQWPFVAVGALVSYLAARSLRNPDSTLSASELRSVRGDEWASAIDTYMEEASKDVGRAIRGVLDQVEAEAIELLERQIVAIALGGKTPTARLAELRRLESLRQCAELIVEELGNPVLELPASRVLTAGLVSVDEGNRLEAQSSIRRILSSSREMLAITDGELDPSAFPLLLEVPEDVAIRILAWTRPTSTAGEAFRIRLAELRSKRTGGVHVVAPVETGSGAEPLPSATWLFVPGWAYKLNLPLVSAWDASLPSVIEAFEDDGSLYQRHFGRWFDDNVPGYQGLQV